MSNELLRELQTCRVKFMTEKVQAATAALDQEIAVNLSLIKRYVAPDTAAQERLLERKTRLEELLALDIEFLNSLTS